MPVALSGESQYDIGKGPDKGCRFNVTIESDKGAKLGFIRGARIAWGKLLGPQIAWKGKGGQTRYIQTFEFHGPLERAVIEAAYDAGWPRLWPEVQWPPMDWKADPAGGAE